MLAQSTIKSTEFYDVYELVFKLDAKHTTKLAGVLHWSYIRMWLRTIRIRTHEAFININMLQEIPLTTASNVW